MYRDFVYTVRIGIINSYFLIIKLTVNPKRLRVNNDYMEKVSNSPFKTLASCETK